MAMWITATILSTVTLAPCPSAASSHSTTSTVMRLVTVRVIQEMPDTMLAESAAQAPIMVGAIGAADVRANSLV